ncbi:phage tail assembly chaperone [Agrobacterium sp. a22-2]|nr:phage tail assembly chaperone [Agrobacterium sp. a22-2]
MAGLDPSPFPWGPALHAGLCLLRLDPTVFWALSPREFAAMTGAFAPRRGHPQRAELNALMARFPDEA